MVAPNHIRDSLSKNISVKILSPPGLHCTENIPTRIVGKSKQHKRIQTALKICQYPNWTYVKSTNRFRNNTLTTQEEGKNKRHNVVVLYVAGPPERSRRIFSELNIPVHLRSCNTLRQKLVHPKDKINNVFYADQCSEECIDLFIRETKEPFHGCMAQHWRASSGQDSEVHLRLKLKGHSFEVENVYVLEREDRWFERGVKEAINVKLEQPSLNRGGGLTHQLFANWGE